jgi:alpha/beta hydrolase family protein DUF900
MRYRVTGGRSLLLRLLTVLAAGVLWTNGPLPAAAARKDPFAPGQDLGYHPVLLAKDGRAEAASLDGLIGSLRKEQPGPEQIVVMIHGFGTTLRGGIEDYQRLSKRLGGQGEAIGLRTALVGVHWESSPGSLGAWFPQAVGHRLTSLLGMRKAVNNPYLEKMRLARCTGRNGLRAVFFRLQDAFPAAKVHVLAHSMGAQAVVSAMAPDCWEPGEKERSIEQRERTLRLGVVTLAGADIDCDVFCRDSQPGIREALAQAEVWWVTVPGRGKADGILELRRGAGRGDAVGNRGIELEREDLNNLLTRRGLVLDQGNVPVEHRMTDYYNERRLEGLAQSLLYLQDPAAPAGQKSILASLDRILEADPGTLASEPKRDACVSLYTDWRLDPGAGGVDGVRIARDKRSPSAKVAGVRQEAGSGRRETGGGKREK